jgi:hypothetical protein
MAKVFLLAFYFSASVCDSFRICLLEKHKNYQSLHDKHENLSRKFDGLGSKYKMLKSEFKKLTDVKAAAEKLRLLEIDNKRLIAGKQMFTTTTANILSKSSAQINNISSHKVDSVLSAPCPTFSVLHAVSKEGNREYRKNEDEDSYIKRGWEL